MHEMQLCVIVYATTCCGKQHALSMRAHVAQSRVKEARQLHMQHSSCSPIKHCTCAIPAVKVASRPVLTTAYAPTAYRHPHICTVSAYSSGKIAGHVSERWPFRRRQTCPRRQRATPSDLSQASVEQVCVWDYILFFQVTHCQARSSSAISTVSVL